MVEEAYQQLGGLDNVTLVAGHQLYQDELSEFKTQDFTETFETNVYPVFWTVQKALEYLQPGGSITTTSSVQGYNPSPILHDYAATKAAIISLTKSFSDELGPKVFVLTVLRLDRFGHHFKLSVDNHKVLYLLWAKHTVRDVLVSLLNVLGHMCY